MQSNRDAAALTSLSALLPALYVRTICPPPPPSSASERGTLQPSAILWIIAGECLHL